MVIATVIVVEDEPFTRTMLATTLAAMRIDVAAACASAAQALAAQQAHEVDVALLDLDLGPGPSGVDIAYALRERQPSIGLVFLTSFSDPRVKDPSGRPLPRGARFVVKSRVDDAAALRDVIVDARRWPLRAEPERPSSEHALTTRQLVVLRHVAAGRSNAEIAGLEGVSEKAVEGLVARILDALGIDRASGNSRVLLARAYAGLSGKSLPAE